MAELPPRAKKLLDEARGAHDPPPGVRERVWNRLERVGLEMLLIHGATCEPKPIPNVTKPKVTRVLGLRWCVVDEDND